MDSNTPVQNKGSKRGLIIGIVAGVLLIAAIATVLMLFVFSKKDSQENKNTSTTQKVEPETSTDDTQATQELKSELMRVYESSDAYSSDMKIATIYDVNDSSIRPYQTLAADIVSEAEDSAAIGLFYRVSPDSPWIWGYATQAASTCAGEWSYYSGKSTDFLKAFADDTCYPNSQDGNMITVKEFYKL